MGIVRRLLRPNEQRTLATGSTAWLAEAMLGAPSGAGISVTPENSLRYTAVLACVRVLAEGVASLPCLVYERYQEQGRDAKRRAPGHPIYTLLHDTPNPVITAFELYEIGMAHLLLWGNFYAEIQWNQRGQAEALWPLAPWRVEPAATRQGKVYEITWEDSNKTVLPDYRVLHVPAFGYDGVQGKSMISLARDAVGLGLAAERFGGAFFGNGARPGVVLEHPGTLSDEAYKRLSDSWNAQHQGLNNAQRLAILEEGMKLEAFTIPPEDAQFLQTRQFQRSEIAAIYRVPPHMIGDLERATFSNIEQQSTDFHVNTMAPWLRRWEQRLGRSLLLDQERTRFFVEFLVDATLRADTQTRYQAYATGRQWGWLSVNDIRTRENMNPVDGGEEYLVPMNMVPAEDLPESDGSDGSGEEDRSGGATERRMVDVSAAERRMATAKGRQKLAKSYAPTLAHTGQRIVNREKNDIGAAAKRYLADKNLAGFETWLMGFDRTHSTFVREYIENPLLSYLLLVAAEVEREIGQEIDEERLTQFSQDYVTGRRNGWMAELMRRLRQAYLRDDDEDLDDWDPLEDVLALLEQRKDGYAATWARGETIQAAGATALAVMGIAGIVRKVWAAGGDSCDWCQALDGVVVEIDAPFLSAGQGLSVNGETFSNAGNIGYPPLHDGCQCQVVAE